MNPTEKQFIEVFMTEPYWDPSKGKWRASFSEKLLNTSYPYFKVRIPLPDEYVKNYLGTLEADKPILIP